MHLPGSTLAHAALAAALVMALYAGGLDWSPPHLTHDEIKFAIQAHSLATTGRDINHRLLPLYFVEPGFSVGRDPQHIYVTAAVLTVLPLDEFSIRFATVIVGSVAVGLLYVLAKLVFRSSAIASVVAAVMALSPTYYIHSRLALSVLYPVPFTILWLIALRCYLTERTSSRAYTIGLALGAGVYSYLAAAIMMPLYLLVTVAMRLWAGDRSGAARIATAFAVMLVPLVLWQAVEPERYRNIIGAYRLFDDQPGVEPAPMAQEAGSRLRRSVDTFWAAFDPGTMFFTGESSLQISTREVGSLLSPIAILLVLGLASLRGGGEDVIPRWLWGFGLISAPLPAVIMADVEIRRWLVLLPFVAIIAGFGVQRLLSGGLTRRTILAALLALCLAQFGWFLRDFFGPYRARSSPWFGGNIRAAVTRVLDDARVQPPSRVYISSEIPWVDAYWQFYTLVRGQRDLLGRTEYVARGEWPVPTEGAVLVAAVPRAGGTAAFDHPDWAVAAAVPDLDGSPSLVLLRAKASP